MKVICISGHAGSGKDTFAGFLEKELTGACGVTQCVLVTHYADLLKYICKTFWGWNGEKDTFGRSLLQSVGTNTIREADPDYWVRFIADMLNFFDGAWDYVLIPDTRFPNEIEYLAERGFYVVHIRMERDDNAGRVNEEQAKHISETSLDDYPADYYIENNGSMDDLKLSAELVVDDIECIKGEAACAYTRRVCENENEMKDGE